jgi:DNA modification methylase
MIHNSDSLEYISSLDDKSVDIIYADPPYALGSQIEIKDGKPNYKVARDFMQKWEMPNGEYWEAWYKQAFRVLKHGGFCIMFGIDRQTLLFKYYGINAGLNENQSLYWFFISNFPKASDLSKNLDKYFGEEREVVGFTKQGKYSIFDGGKPRPTSLPTSLLSKKYDGYKYSIAPLKQTCQEIMIFQKPYKTGSCLHDTLAFENGDEECCCGALNIDDSRVPTDSNLLRLSNVKGIWSKEFRERPQITGSVAGRYPAQTFLTDTENILDKQSGVVVSTQSKGNDNRYLLKKESKWNVSFCAGDHTAENSYSDIGGCSRILHSCKYEEGDYDLFQYCPVVSPREREAGCGKFELKEYSIGDERPCGGFNERLNMPASLPKSNTHPTLKPISLNYRILLLFKTPNEQKIIYPFAGVGSEIIGGIKAGFLDWEGCEINPEYVEIANARIKHHTSQLDLFIN